MNYHIDPEIEKHHDLIEHVESANCYVAGLGGEKPLPMMASWKFTRNTPAGSGIELSLSMGEDFVNRSFTANELRNPEIWRPSVKRVWWELLLSNQRHTGEKILNLLNEWKQEISAVSEG